MCHKDKTEVIVFVEELKASAQLQSVKLRTTNQTKNLGVVMDLDLHLNSNIKANPKSAYYHLKNIVRIKGCMSQQDLEKTCPCVHI